MSRYQRQSVVPGQKVDTGSVSKKSGVTATNISLNTEPPKPPTPARQWLGKNPQVVMFAITFENDRLCNENQALKNRLRDVEGAAIDLQNQLTEANRIIEELKAKLGSVDNSLVKKLEDANKRIKQLEDDLLKSQNEVKTQQTKYSTDKNNWDIEIKKLNDLLNAKIKEFDEYKRNQGKDFEALQKKYQELEKKYQDLEKKNTTLQSEVDRLNLLIKGWEAKGKEWDLKFATYESRINDYELKLKDWESRYKALELRLTELTNLLSLRDQELADWKLKYAALDADWKLKYAALDADWKTKYAALELKFNNSHGSLAEYELKFTKLNLEIDRLNGLVKTMQSEIDDLKARLSKAEQLIKQHEDTIRRLELELTNLRNEMRDRCAAYDLQLKNLQLMIDDLNNQIRQYKLEMERYEGLLRDWELKFNNHQNGSQGQISALMTQIQNLENTIISLSNRIKQLLLEIDNLNQLLRLRLKDNHDLQNKYMQQEYVVQDLMGNQEKYRQMENRLQNLGQLNDDQRLRITNLEFQLLQQRALEIKNQENDTTISIYRKEIQDYTNQIGDLLAQNNKLTETIVNLQTENIQLKQNEMIIRELENKVQQLHDLNDQIQDLSFDRANQLNDLQVHSNQMEAHVDLNRQLQDRILQLENTLNDNQKEQLRLIDQINQLKITNSVQEWQINRKSTDVQSRDDILQAQDQRLSKLLNENQIERTENLSLESKLTQLKQLEDQLQQRNTQITNLNAEVQRVSNDCGQKGVDNENLKHKINLLELQVSDLKFTEARVQDLEIRYVQLQKDFEVSQSNLRLKSSDADHFQRSSEQAESSLHSLNQNYDNIRLQFQSQEKQLLQFGQLKQRVQEQDSLITQLNKDIERLNQTLKQEQEENGSLRSANTEGRNEIQRLSAQEVKLLVLVPEVERLKQVLMKQDEELDQWRDRSNENSDLGRKVQEQLNMLVMLFAECEGLKQKFSSKERELEEVRATRQ